MALTWPFKDPNEVLDYTVDWEDRLGGDTIDDSVWEFADEADSLLVMDSDSHTDTVTTLWLSAGTIGQTYQLTNRITTAGARVMDQTVKIKVKAK